MANAGSVIVTSQRLAHLAGTWSEGPGPAHERLCNALRLLILDGLVPIGTTVPGERDLASALACSRTTVGAAYRRLVDEGFLSSEERRRSRIRLPDSALADAAQRGGAGPILNFASAAPHAPRGILNAAFNEALQELPRYYDDDGYNRRGVEALRSAVASWYDDRGLPTRPDQVMVTHGAQHALSLIARSFLSPHDRVIIDHPTYPNAITTFVQARARPIPIALRNGGWDIPELITASRTAQLAYLIPDFHNPTGARMAETDREQLTLSCPTVIDETLAEVNFTKETYAPTALYQRNAISIGSVSKSIWGGLRVGWVRAAPKILDQLDSNRPTIDLGNPILEQLATATLLNAKQNRRPNDLHELAERRDFLIGLLKERIPQIQLNTPPGGLTLWATLPTATAVRIAAAAPDHGLTLAAGPRFGIGGAFGRNIRLPYTDNRAQLDEAVKRLHRTIDAVGQGAAGKHRPAPLQ